MPCTAPNQNMVRQPAWSTNSPPSSRPAPALNVAIALSQPMATGTRSARNRSRTMPMASGSKAADMPCKARPQTSPGSPLDRALISDPVAEQASIASTRRLRPNRSPSRDDKPAETDPTSR
jgi:hypothetical protein